jgi:hypothetical protein
MAYDDYGYDHWDAHDYSEYEPDEEYSEDGDWYAEEGEAYLRAEVYEPLAQRIREEE